MLESALGCIEQDKVFWKWSILATHSAVQGACVCFLTRTDGGGALDKRSEMSLLAYHNQSSQMASSKKYNRDRKLGSLDYPKNSEIPSNGVRNLDFQRLHNFRNKLTHFESVSWSLEIEDLPRIIREALSLTKSNVSSNDYKRWNKFKDMDVEAIVENCQSILDRLDGISPK